MKNCSFERINSAVENGSLDVYGHVEFACRPTYVTLCANEAKKVLLTVDGGTIGGSASTYAVVYDGEGDPSTKLVSANQGVSVVKIDADEKYDITALGEVYPIKGLGSLAYTKGLLSISYIDKRIDTNVANAVADININELASFKNKNLIKFKASMPSGFSSKIKGNIGAFRGYGDLKQLNIRVSNVYGDISELNTLTDLEVLDIMLSGVFGDIASLGTLVNIKEMSLINAPSVENSVTGTLESFVQAQRTAGRTTESTGITILRNLGDVTFNGEAIPRADTTHTLTWTESTITFDGTTINA